MDHRHRYKKHSHLNFYLNRREYTLCLSDIFNGHLAGFEYFFSFDFRPSLENPHCLYTHIQPMTAVVASLTQSALRKQRKGIFPLRHTFGKPFCQQTDVHIHFNFISVVLFCDTKNVVKL